jgi:cAMP-dependent protein kinase regulator
LFTGEEGDYFYIIEKGQLNVFVDGKQVGKIGDGKCFGELSLVYNTPRAATITADTPSTLFSLARQTFKFVLANNTEHFSTDVRQALHRVPILESLTDEQLDKIADAVAVVSYKPGISSRVTLSQCCLKVSYGV